MQANKRPRTSKSELDSSSTDDNDKTKRKSGAARSLQHTTKATLWIESRKSSPRTRRSPGGPRSAARPAPRSAPRPAPRAAPRSARRPAPLRLAVLRRARSAPRSPVAKIQAPLTIGTRQASYILRTHFLTW